MTDEKSSNMVRLRNGSIDYQYYSARGVLAKNEELKLVADKLFGASRMTVRIFPVFLTVLLVALIF